MWLKDWLKTPRLIGCEISSHVRLAQVQESGELAVQAVELPQHLQYRQPNDEIRFEQEVGELIREMLRAGKFHGRDVVTCLPPEQLRFRTMRLAPMAEEELPQAVHWKAASELGIKPEQFKSGSLNFGKVAENGKERLEVLSIGAETSRLERFAAALVNAGLRPVAIDCSIAAAARCLTSGAGSGPEVKGPSEDVAAPLSPHSSAVGPSPKLILELARGAATIVVADQGKIIFARPVGAGLGRVHELLARLVEMPLPDARRLHDATVAVMNAGTGDGTGVTKPAYWSFPQCSFDKAREALIDASRMYGRDLAREVTLSLHYFTATFGGALPDVASVVASSDLHNEVLEALSAPAEIAFETVSSLGNSTWNCSLMEADAGQPGAWVTAVGLSLAK